MSLGCLLNLETSSANFKPANKKYCVIQMICLRSALTTLIIATFDSRSSHEPKIVTDMYLSQQLRRIYGFYRSK